MLEVSPVFAANKPEIQVHPLGIGGKSDPARLRGYTPAAHIMRWFPRRSLSMISVCLQR